MLTPTQTGESRRQTMVGRCSCPIQLPFQPDPTSQTNPYKRLLSLNQKEGPQMLFDAPFLTRNPSIPKSSFEGPSRVCEFAATLTTLFSLNERSMANFISSVPLPEKSTPFLVPSRPRSSWCRRASWSFPSACSLHMSNKQGKR